MSDTLPSPSTSHYPTLCVASNVPLLTCTAALTLKDVSWHVLELHSDLRLAAVEVLPRLEDEGHTCSDRCAGNRTKVEQGAEGEVKEYAREHPGASLF